jgi:hypothetical protein
VASRSWCEIGSYQPLGLELAAGVRKEGDGRRFEPLYVAGRSEIPHGRIGTRVGTIVLFGVAVRAAHELVACKVELSAGFAGLLAGLSKVLVSS